MREGGESAISAKGRQEWGLCRECSTPYTVKKDGTLRKHGGLRGGKGICEGSGKKPLFMVAT